MEEGIATGGARGSPLSGAVRLIDVDGRDGVRIDGIEGGRLVETEEGAGEESTTRVGIDYPTGEDGSEGRTAVSNSPHVHTMKTYPSLRESSALPSAPAGA